MAAKRLSTARRDLPPGFEFDANDSFEVPIRGSKLIQGMTRGLAYMIEKNVIHAELRCRSDYAYGAEGYRKTNGDVLVPPFASLQFDVKILNSHSQYQKDTAVNMKYIVYICLYIGWLLQKRPAMIQTLVFTKYRSNRFA